MAIKGDLSWGFNQLNFLPVTSMTKPAVPILAGPAPPLQPAAPREAVRCVERIASTRIWLLIGPLIQRLRWLQDAVVKAGPV